jgi:hypothetical protein
MFTDAIILIDQTIDNLETLAVVLADGSDERIQMETDKAAVFKFAHARIETLLPALRSVRTVEEAAIRAANRGHCLDCE